MAKGFGRAPDLEGFDATVASFKNFASRVDEVMDDAIETYARRMFDLSQRYVPVRDPERTPPRGVPGGSLKSSGFVEHLGPGRWQISYGAPGGDYREAWYAVYVHEMPNVRGGGPNRGYKFLEKAVNEVLPEMNAGIAQAFAEETGGRGRFTSTFGATGEGGRFVHGSELSDFA